MHMLSMSELGTSGGIFQHTAQGISGPWCEVGAGARCGEEVYPGQMWGRGLSSKQLLAEASNSFCLADLERLGEV